MKSLVAVAAIISAATAVECASAQVVAPNAGSIQRDLSRTPALPQPLPAPIAPSERASASDEGTAVTVRAFKIEGVTLMPEAAIQALVADRIGRALTMRQLRDVTNAIAAYYRDQGLSARVILPSQDVTTGVVLIRVIEGRLGKTTLSGEPNPHVSAQRLIAVVTSRLREGHPYSMDDLERGLLLANDLPGVQVTGSLKPGASQGDSDLLLEVKNRSRLLGAAGVTNFGSRALGATQVNLSLGVGSPTGYGDQLMNSLSHSDGLDFARSEYSLPVGADGLRASVSASHLRYALGKSFAALGAGGTSTTVGFELRYPLIRSERRNLWLSLGADRNHYVDTVFDLPLHNKSVRNTTVSITGDGADAQLGGHTQFSLRLISSRLNLSASPADVFVDELGPNANGSADRLQFDIKRVQSLNWWGLGGLYGKAAASGQLSSRNLDGSLKFSLGGAGGVRGYPSGEASGDRGLLLSGELHKRWTTIDLFAFADVGRVQQHTHTWAGWDGYSDEPNSYWLQSAGLGLGYSFNSGASLSLQLATPIGPHPGNVNGRNQDGSARGLRAWASLNAPF